MFNINFILAISNDNIIGINNTIPWSISDDLKRFKSLTTDDDFSNVVIMGLKTFESIGYKSLSNRFNIVLTSKFGEMKNKKDLIYLSNLENALYYCELNNNFKNIWIIGGKQLFESIDSIKPNMIYMTKINKSIDINSENMNVTKLSDNFINSLETNYSIQNKSTSLVFDKLSSNEVIIEYIDYVRNVDFLKIQYPSTGIINTGEQQYFNLLKSIIIDGDFRATRNDYTWSEFGAQLNFDMADGFPLLTSKKMSLRIIFEELMFFIRGYTDNKILKEKNIHIWDSNTDIDFIQNNNITYENSESLLNEDDMGPMYGFQWRYFNVNYDRVSSPSNSSYYKSNNKFDQLQKVLNELKTDPYSRRIIMTTFNPAQVSNGVLYPCHSIVIQFYAKSDKNDPNNLCLNIKMYQRSADVFLGLPFNIASTSLLLHLVCDYLNLSNTKFHYIPSKVIITLGDTHIYQSHIDPILTQLQSKMNEFPTLKILHNNDYPITSIEDYEWSNIELTNYISNKVIKAKMIA